MKDISRRSFVQGVLGALAGAKVIEARTIDSTMSKKNDIILEEKLTDSTFLSSSSSCSTFTTYSSTPTLEELTNFETAKEQSSRNLCESDYVWYHLLYQKVGSIEEMTVDGMSGEDISHNMKQGKVLLLYSTLADILANCEIKDYRSEQIGNVAEVEFWFRERFNEKST